MKDNNSDLYHIAKQELDNKNYDDTLWRKAMALTGDNELNAKEKYIKLRILQLKRDGYQPKKKVANPDSTSSNGNTNKSKNKRKSSKKDNPNDNGSWIFWVSMGIFVIWLIIELSSGSKFSKNTSSASNDRSSNYPVTKKDDYAESKPSVSTYTLGKNQLLYCEAEKIRLDFVKDKIDRYSKYEIDKYNSLLSDHNSRCANKQYYEKDMYKVNKLINNRKNKIKQEGLDRFQKPKKKKLNNTSNYNNIYDTKASNTSSRTGSCKVTIFNDGSIGAEINGKFRQWKYMSTREKSQCEKALRQEQSKNKSNFNTVTYAEKKRKQKYPLTINTTPSSARVQIMNIKPKYYDGILLVKGKYKIRVTKKGYERVEAIVDPSESAIYNFTIKKKHNTSASSTHASRNKITMSKREQDNFNTCIRGDFPTLCKHSWLTSAQKKEVGRAERKYNYQQCIRGDFPTLCKHSWLTSSQAKKVKEAERKIKLKRGY